MQIQYGAGSVIGRKHRELGLNRQDAFQVIRSPNRFVGVITDGLSLIVGPDGEIPTNCEYGATLGAHLIAKNIGELSLRVDSRHEREVFTGRPFWQRIEEDTLAYLRTDALHFGGNFQSVIEKYFLFTSLGVLITPNVSVFYGIGDGNFYVNGERIQLGPFPDNQPPYLGHRLLSGSRHISEQLQFKVYSVISTPDLKNFLVGSDGVNDLIDNAEKPLSGRKELVGSISQFWEKDTYFKDEAAVDLRLNMIAEDRQTVNWEDQELNKYPGLLPDDTTLITGRQIV